VLRALSVTCLVARVRPKATVTWVGALDFAVVPGACAGLGDGWAWVVARHPSTSQTDGESVLCVLVRRASVLKTGLLERGWIQGKDEASLQGGRGDLDRVYSHSYPLRSIMME
jgi:hypothetical protein